MPGAINPIRKAKVKQAILQGKPFNQALREAGYTEGSAHKSSVMPVVKVCRDEIRQAMDKVAVSDEYVLEGLKREAETAKNSSDRIAALSWLGKYRAMFTEKHLVDANIITKQEQSLLDKYINNNRLIPSG